MKTKTKLVRGIGINDATYCVVVKNDDGTKTMCPIYRIWSNMLTRCYSDAFVKNNPTYSNCVVSDDWLIFSVFRDWVLSQDWEDKELDKDLLVQGNQLYSSDTCVFISRRLNTFIASLRPLNGITSIGVYFVTQKNLYRATCGNPFLNKKEHLGYFDSQEAAHFAWVNRKKCIAQQLVADIKDERIVNALFDRIDSLSS